MPLDDAACSCLEDRVLSAKPRTRRGYLLGVREMPIGNPMTWYKAVLPARFSIPRPEHSTILQLSKNMPIAAKNSDNSATIPKGKSCHEFVAQPVVTDITEQLSETSFTPNVDPAAFIAELDGTPIESRKIPVASSSTPSKTPIGDVTVMVVDDTNYEDYKTLAGEKPAVAHLLEKIAKAKAAKMKDPAVLINLPSSPSAQAYEVARDAKRPGDKDLFDPTYADTDDHNDSLEDENA